MGKLKVKKRKQRSATTYGAGEGSDAAELEARIERAGQRENAADSAAGVKDAEVMGYFTLQSEYAFVARALSQMDGVGKSLDPEFDFISAAAPYLVEVKGTTRYLMDEAKKRLTFVYDPEDGILAKQLALARSVGFKRSAVG